MFVLVRALVYAAIFIGFVLVNLPGRFLSWSGIVAPVTTGGPQVAGMMMVTVGTAIALWYVFTLVFIDRCPKYSRRCVDNEDLRRVR